MAKFLRGAGEDMLRSINRIDQGKTAQKMRDSQMNTAQGISDAVRHQGVYERPGINRQQQELPVDHPDATVGD